MTNFAQDMRVKTAWGKSLTEWNNAPESQRRYWREKPDQRTLLSGDSMTDLTERLDAIQARAKDLTDLCAEHLRQSIRHVQRNCDIECNVHEDSGAWDACKQPDRRDGDRMAALLAEIPALLDLARKQGAALDELLYIADNKAAKETHVGRWWSAVLRNTIEKHMEAKP